MQTHSVDTENNRHFGKKIMQQMLLMQWSLADMQRHLLACLSQATELSMNEWIKPMVYAEKLSGDLVNFTVACMTKHNNMFDS